MGGTGLSGLALTDTAGPFPEPWRDVMLLANPITNQTQRDQDAPRRPALETGEARRFLMLERPVVPPRRDQHRPRRLPLHRRLVQQDHLAQRSPAKPSRPRQNPRPHLARAGRPRAKPFEVPDFTKLSGDELIAKLGGDSLTQSHLAWQAIGDRDEGAGARCCGDRHARRLVRDAEATAARRIAGVCGPLRSSARGAGRSAALALRCRVCNRCQRCSPERRKSQHAARSSGGARRMPESTPRSVAGDWIARRRSRSRSARGAHPPVCGAWCSTRAERRPARLVAILRCCLRELRAAGGAIAPCTQNKKPIKVREAYDREFERYLVRCFSSSTRQRSAKFLDLDGRGETAASRTVCSPRSRSSRKPARRAWRSCCRNSSARRARRRCCASRNFPMSPASARR